MLFGKKSKEKNPSEEMKFTARLGRYFSTEPQKERVLRREDFHAVGDVYYADVSASYKVLQRGIWLVFILFMVCSLVFNYSAITYDNFFYLIKDFSSAADSGGTNYETLSYEADSRQKFQLYRGGVAAVSPSKISVFTATGRRTLNAASAYSSPYIISSDRYILIYDTAGKNFSLYNSFARIHTESLEYPVYDACFGEDGSFAIATRTADSLSSIHLYDKNFKFAGKVSEDIYVFDLAMNRSQNALSVLSYEMGDGVGRTVLTTRNTKTLQAEEKIHFDGEFPLGCVYIDSNLLAVMTDRYVRILDKNFEEIAISADYSGEEILAYNLTEEGVVLATSYASQTNLIAFDKKGKMVYNDFVRLNPSDVALYGSYLFLQTERGVTRIRHKNGDQEQLDCGRGTLLIYNESTAVVCGESKAEYLVFRD